MKSEFNETTYQTVFICEFYKTFNQVLGRPPIIPSLITEGDSGYDAELRLRSSKGLKSIFLQFKIPAYMEKWDSCIQDHRFYKIKITKLSKSKQHNLLVNLSRRGEAVFYNTPIFHRDLDLVSFSANSQVVSQSRFFNPQEIGYIQDNLQHHIKYDVNGDKAFFQSDPRQVQIQKDFEAILNLTQEIEEDYSLKLLKKLFDIYKEVYGFEFFLPDKLRDFVKDVSEINYILKKYFGLTWFLVDNIHE